MIKNFFIAILLFIIVWYLAKAIVRLFNLFISSKSEAGKSSGKNSSNKNNITFDFPDEKKKRFDKNEGDYVDFEEVK